jgi:uncharacterized membrane protein HdeD (DUF308 family)
MSIIEKAGKEIKDFKNETIIADVLVIIFGLIMMIFPGISQAVICRVVGIVLIILGGTKVITYFSMDRVKVVLSFELIIGVALICIGLYFLIKPDKLAEFLTIIMAIVLIVGGTMKAQYAIDYKRLSFKNWWIQLIGALITIILGIIVFANPFGASISLMIFIGISLIIDGIWDLVTIIHLSANIKNFNKEIDTTANEIDSNKK